MEYLLVGSGDIAMMLEKSWSRICWSVQDRPISNRLSDEVQGLLSQQFTSSLLSGTGMYQFLHRNLSLGGVKPPTNEHVTFINCNHTKA